MSDEAGTHRRHTDLVVGCLLGAAVVGLAAVVVLQWERVGGDPPASPSVQGSLEIHSEPPGAMVTLDGVEVLQRTPSRLDPVTLGEIHHLEISAPGYVTQTIDTLLSPDKPHGEIRVVLARGPVPSADPPAAPGTVTERAREP